MIIEDVEIIVVSLGGVVGPFQPYLKVEEEKEVKPYSQGLTATLNVDRVVQRT